MTICAASTMPFGLLLFAIAIAFAIRLMAGQMDRKRIYDYIAGRGGRVLSVQWTPFGRGWFGERSDRIYAVRYVDAEGNTHEATCKTSMFTGVYFSEDEVLGRTADAQKPVADDWRVSELERENRRLRRELEERRRSNP